MSYSNNPSHSWKDEFAGFARLCRKDILSYDTTLSYTPQDTTKPTVRFDFSSFTRSTDNRVPISCHLTNSCNGLVGIYSDYGHFFIANPSIMKLSVLPKSTYYDWGNCVGAIGFDESTGVYKIVRLINLEYHKFACEVFTGTCWKKVDVPRQIRVNVASHMYSPFEHNEIIYCHVESKSGPEIALCFDVKKEKFSVIFHPNHNDGGKMCQEGEGRLAFLEGYPCATYYSNLRMTIWRLKNRKNSKWEKLYDIDYSTIYKVEDRRWIYLMLPLEVKDGKIVFYYLIEGGREYYDIATKSFGKSQKINKVQAEMVTPCTESTVWPWPQFPSELSLKKIDSKHVTYDVITSRD